MVIRVYQTEKKRVEKKPQNIPHVRDMMRYIYMHKLQKNKYFLQKVTICTCLMYTYMAIEVK
tara:strand:- start:165 stop:350 length:186 start_codon:yes stop_codon:yes gene_type:complete